MPPLRYGPRCDPFGAQPFGLRAEHRIDYRGARVTAPARFTQADIRRAAAGVTAAGLGIAKIEIDLSGKIVIIPATGQPQADNDEWADLA